MLSKANLWTNRKELWTDRKTTGTIMGASALANIDKGLHHLFLSQIETLGMEPVARRSGIVSQLAPERGRGSAWMAGIGPDCLMTVLDLEVEGAVDLSSCGPGYFCLGIMSPSCLETMPRPVSAPGPAGLVMYCQDAGSYAYRLKPRTPYVSRSLCFTPRFWEQLAFDRRSDGDALLERFATAPQVLNAPHVGAMLQRLDARTADAAATELHLTALAAEAVACLMDTAEAEGQAEAARGSSEAARLARDARALLERHLDAPLTLESIARELCVSRSRLAATYKAERGRGVAEELRDLRMERARELLAGTDLPLSEVGRAVGYPRPTTFATAFSREVGCSPAAWRKQHRL